MIYDVFNGDADGIIAILQLHLSNPVESVKVTGVKRDIELLKRVNAKQGDEIRVADISMEKNTAALSQVLDNGAFVFYADHHRSGDIPKNDNLNALVDMDPNICSSLIVSKYLDQAHHSWAICAAYGDNLFERADAEAKALGFNRSQRDSIKALGTYINYNSYGSTEADLHFSPSTLLGLLLPYQTPLDFIGDSQSVFSKLEAAYQEDMAKAKEANTLFESNVVSLIELPDQAWSRRVSGVFGNALANQYPNRAHAIISSSKDGSYAVSIRAPLNNKQGADHVACQFPTGGGRAAAAGINRIGKADVEDLLAALLSQYQ